MRILVADDEFAAVTKMMTMLSSLGDCVPATHGRQAFDLFAEAILKKEPFDLVTIDIDMPALNGLMLLRLMNEREKEMIFSPAKKIMISAGATEFNVLQAGM